MYAIHTSYHISGSGQIAVTSAAGSDYDYKLDPSMSLIANHEQAARIYAESKGWTNEWIGALNASGDGYVFVREDATHKAPAGFISVVAADEEGSS